MIYNYFVLLLLIGVSVTIVQTAHAQLYNTTIPVPISVPPLQYTPNMPVQTATTQETNTDLTAIISSIVVTAIGVITAKVHSDKKTNLNSVEIKDLIAEVLKGKEVDKELARVTYKMNEAEANKITDAPAVKNETLAQDVSNYSEKAAKA